MGIRTLFVTRQRYDQLIDECPNWMEHRWPEYTRRWTLAGVFVTGTDGQIENLIAQLNRKMEV